MIGATTSPNPLHGDLHLLLGVGLHEMRRKETGDMSSSHER